MKTKIVFASLDALRNIVKECQAMCFVWPKEGEFVESNFRFNTDHKGYEPLLVDLFSASRMIAVYDALKPENKDKMGRMVAASRGQFMKVHEIAMRV